MTVGSVGAHVLRTVPPDEQRNPDGEPGQADHERREVAREAEHEQQAAQYRHDQPGSARQAALPQADCCAEGGQQRERVGGAEQRIAHLIGANLPEGRLKESHDADAQGNNDHDQRV